MHTIKGLVSILVVTWNRKDALARALDSAMQQSYPQIEIVLIDNASTDGTEEFIRQRFPSVRYIRLDKNIGCPSGRNIGFGECNGDFVYLLDDDGWLDPKAVEIDVTSAQAHPNAGVVMSKIVEIKEGVVKRVYPPELDVPAALSWFVGCCSLIRSSALAEVGLFPEDFFRQAEEEDLSLRMLDKGYYCWFEPTSIMYHDHSPVGRDQRLFAYYTLRNTTKTALRYYPAKWVVIRMVKNIIHCIRYTIQLRMPGLPFSLLKDFCSDITRLKSERHPVSNSTMSLYEELERQPMLNIPQTNSNK